MTYMKFLPRANSGNRYIASPDSEDNRDQFGIRMDYQLSQDHSILGRYLRTGTESISPPTTRPIGTTSQSTLQDFMFSDTYIFSSNAINVARFSYNRISANPQLTSGLLNSDYFINLPHNVPQAQGLANITVKNGQEVGWPGDGIDLLNAQNVTIGNVQVRSNGGTGIMTGSLAIIEDCIAQGHSGGGIVAGTESVVSGCTAANNTGIGI